MVRSSFHRRAPPKNFWFDSHTVKSRTPRITSTQILTTLSMTISPDSKTGQRWKRDWYAGIPCLGQLAGRTTLTPHHHCVVSSVKLNHDCPITHHSVFRKESLTFKVTAIYVNSGIPPKCFDLLFISAKQGMFR